MLKEIFLFIAAFFTGTLYSLPMGRTLDADSMRRYAGQNAFFNAGLWEKGDSIILVLRNNTADTLAYNLGFFAGMDSASRHNCYDYNLLLDRKIMGGK